MRKVTILCAEKEKKSKNMKMQMKQRKLTRTKFEITKQREV